MMAGRCDTELSDRNGRFSFSDHTDDGKLAAMVGVRDSGSHAEASGTPFKSRPLTCSPGLVGRSRLVHRRVSLTAKLKELGHKRARRVRRRVTSAGATKLAVLSEGDGVTSSELSTVCSSDWEEAASVSQNEEEPPVLSASCSSSETLVQRKPDCDNHVHGPLQHQAETMECKLLGFGECHSPGCSFAEPVVFEERMPFHPEVENREAATVQCSREVATASCFQDICSCWPYLCSGFCDSCGYSGQTERGEVTLGKPSALDVFMFQEGLRCCAGFGA
ncbi:hypothetical protein CSUI_000962 [Cystoisospora suis]|uniref:Uncharacterized protein n=1 Tax=Cystoisospora suis TaxID=483139 RepID=A0A2C6KME1_9APIC|nr:hypothetical protein CSUI_000962 [Cystoisospora suis]